MRDLLAGTLLLVAVLCVFSVYLGFRLVGTGQEVARLNLELAKASERSRKHAKSELSYKRVNVRLHEALNERTEELARSQAVRAVAGGAPILKGVHEVDSLQEETVSDIWFCSKAVLSRSGVIVSEDILSRTLEAMVSGETVMVAVDAGEQGKHWLRVSSDSTKVAREIKRQIDLLLANNF